MGMTISEKILAAHAGKNKVEPGEFIEGKVDVGTTVYFAIPREKRKTA